MVGGRRDAGEQAKAGEIVMNDSVYASVADTYPELEFCSIEVRGEEEPVEIRVLRPD